MHLTTRAVKNVGAIWLNLLVHAVVGFFLSPLILHRLGDQLFSLWVLVFTLTGYYGLLDLGIRSATVRYVAKFATVHDQDGLVKFVNTSLAFYCGVGLLSLLLTGIGYFYLPILFKLPSADLLVARVLLLIAGTGMAFSFAFNVFMGILEGLERFASLGLTQVGFTLLRGALIVIALNHGGKLLAIGSITVGTNLLGYIVFMCLARRARPIQLNIKQVDRRVFRVMMAYGSLAFIILIAEKLRFQSDVTVIGALLSTSAIASFTIGTKLIEYSSYVVRSMAQIFTPMSSQLYTIGDLPQLQRTLVAGNRTCALITFPLCVILIALGKPIIELWVGARYLSSYPILLILVIPRSLYLAQSASTKMLLGMGKHRWLALVLLMEGAVNLVLSIVLARRFGLTGIALGTAIPLTITSLFFLPYHTSHHLRIGVGSFLRRAYLMPLAISVPLASVLLFLEREFPTHGYRALLSRLACGGGVYCTGLYVAAFNHVSSTVRSWTSITIEPRRGS